MPQDHGGQKCKCRGAGGGGSLPLKLEVPYSLFWFGEMDREEGADRRREEFLETKTGRHSHIYLGLVNLD